MNGVNVRRVERYSSGQVLRLHSEKVCCPDMQILDCNLEKRSPSGSQVKTCVFLLCLSQRLSQRPAQCRAECRPTCNKLSNRGSHGDRRP